MDFHCATEWTSKDLQHSVFIVHFLRRSSSWCDFIQDAISRGGSCQLLDDVGYVDTSRVSLTWAIISQCCNVGFDQVQIEEMIRRTRKRKPLLTGERQVCRRMVSQLSSGTCRISSSSTALYCFVRFHVSNYSWRQTPW
jgi:hypothetical protein